MKIPESVKIGGVDYTVKRNVERLGDYEWSAQISFRKAEIEILKDLAPQVEERSFIHEVFHAIFSNLGYSGDSPTEKEVDEVAGAFYQVIKDNPQMFQG